LLISLIDSTPVRVIRFYLCQSFFVQFNSQGDWNVLKLITDLNQHVIRLFTFYAAAYLTERVISNVSLPLNIEITSTFAK
jgi:hypothetical protein